MNGSVIFGAVGDIDFSGACGRAAQEHGLDWPFAPMLAQLRRADLLFGNMESVLLPPDYPEDQIDPAGLVSKTNLMAALPAAGFGFMCLANNHVLDGGTSGMFHTRDALAKVGVATGGIGRTQAEARALKVVEAGGLRVGFLCYCEDTNYSLSTRGPCHAYYTRQAVLEDVARHRGAVDALIVSIHADLEFSATPSSPRRTVFREVARAGATVVLGHHPHVPQGVERVGGSLIAYSLGNFYFPAWSMPYMKDNGPHTADSVLLLVNLSRKGVEGFERVPCRIPAPPEERPTPLTGADAAALLDYYQSLDRAVLDDQLVDRNWRELAMRHFDVYLNRIRTMDRRLVLEDLLGRLLLVQENRQWVDEVMEAVKEKWQEQAGQVHELHRPHFAMKARRDMAG